jgi:hypothetical protein
MAAELRAMADHRAAQWGPVAALHALILVTLARAGGHPLGTTGLRG